MGLLYGGLSVRLSEPSLLNPEVSEVIELSSPKRWDDLNLLTHLYIKKSFSLRRISRELGCSKSVVRRKLSQAGIEIIQQKNDVDRALVKKIICLRERGLSYNNISELLNLWKVDTKSKNGKWFPQTVRDIACNYSVPGWPPKSPKPLRSS